MYGKIFNSIYDGTLAGHWEAIVTMQQFIVLSSPDGIVDMTPEAIAGRTTIPLDIIKKGIAFLEKPDQYSRTPGEEGRRIVLLDDHRPWGWRLVNHFKYRALRDQEQKRQADRDRINEKRRKNNDVAIGSQCVANVAHTDTDTDTDTRTTSDPSPVVEKLPLRSGDEFEVRQSLVDQLSPLYPAVDIPATLKEMRGWLLLNEGRRKTRQGVKAFIGRWLQTEQEKHGG